MNGQQILGFISLILILGTLLRWQIALSVFIEHDEHTTMNGKDYFFLDLCSYGGATLVLGIVLIIF